MTKDWSVHTFETGPQEKKVVTRLNNYYNDLDGLQLELTSDHQSQQMVAEQKKLHKGMNWWNKNSPEIPAGLELAIDSMRKSSDKALTKEGNKMIKQVAAYRTVHQKWKVPAQRNKVDANQVNKLVRKLQSGFELYHKTFIDEIRAKHSNSARVQAVAQSSNVNLSRAQKRDPNKQERERDNALKAEADKAEAALEKHRVNGKKLGQSDAEYKKEEESLKQKAVEKRSKTTNAAKKRCNDAANAKADEAKERLDTLVRNKENMSVEEYQQQYEKLDGEHQALRMKTQKGKRRRNDTINVSKGMDIAKEDIVRIAAEQLKGGNFHVPSKDDVRSKESLRRCAQFETLFDTRDAKKIAAIFN